MNFQGWKVFGRLSQDSGSGPEGKASDRSKSPTRNARLLISSEPESVASVGLSHLCCQSMAPPVGRSLIDRDPGQKRITFEQITGTEDCRRHRLRGDVHLEVDFGFNCLPQIAEHGHATGEHNPLVDDVSG